MRRQSLRTWIKEHREDIDAVVRSVTGRHKGLCVPLNDEERRQWVLNEESLYLWATGEGVEV